MNLYKKYNIQQIELLKEANIEIKDREYTKEECKIIVYKIAEHIMSFSKKEIQDVQRRYNEIINKLN